MRSISTFLFLTIVLLGRQSAGAQTGIGTTTPDPHAILDIESTQKGVLLPRLTAAQQATLAATLTSGQVGMLVTDAVTGKPVYWTGGAWKDASGLSVTATSPLSISSVNTIALNAGTSVGDLITWDGTNWVNMQPATQHFSISVDNRQPYLALNYCIALTGVFPSQNGNTPFLTEIALYAFNFPPTGWALCNGQLLPISQDQAMFALIGTFYGGDGVTTFALPNLQSRTPVHMGSGEGLSTYVLAQTGGTETNTLTR